MFRAGGGDSGGSYNLVTEIFEQNVQHYNIPYGIKNKEIFVICVGGGGGGIARGKEDSYTDWEYIAGGGGGWVNTGIVTVNEGETLNITIGSGGIGNNNTGNGGSGGITSFGTYMSASGGGGAMWSKNNVYGGNGGAGGGASISTAGYNFNNVFGGTGHQFGGGGCLSIYSSDKNVSKGIGGPNGGNGAQGRSNKGQYTSYSNHYTSAISAQNGINTLKIISESDAFNANAIGYGVGGTDWGGGGGGYGANGGNSGNYSGIFIPGGGGGYGAAGYGGDGFGFYDGGSHPGKWTHYAAGGGGSYGHGGSATNAAKSLSFISPTHGGGGASSQSGANGICIIQYYQKT